MEVLKALFQFDHIDVNRKNVDGYTPLHIACKYECHGAIQVLLEVKNLSLDVVDSRGLSAFDIATDNGDRDTLDALTRTKLKRKALFRLSAGAMCKRS